MNERLRIGAREVGPGCPTFTIAEIGVNHDGDVGLALHLVRAAAAAGADAIKLQLFRADRLVDASAGCCEYQNADSQMELLRRYELTTEEVGDVVDAARAAGLVPLATPFSVQDVAVCRELAFPAVKIASPDLVNRPLLREAAKLGVPMLISTGASDEQEIVDTEAWLEGMAVPHVLLHCVSSYPTAMDEARLDWIGRLAEISVWPVGYSDHTTSPLAGALAVAAGACVLEKHLTHDRDAEGPDHAASFEPHELNYYIHQVRVAERMTGVGPRRVLTFATCRPGMSLSGKTLRHAGLRSRASCRCTQARLWVARSPEHAPPDGPSR